MATSCTTPPVTCSVPVYVPAGAACGTCTSTSTARLSFTGTSKGNALRFTRNRIDVGDQGVGPPAGAAVAAGLASYVHQRFPVEDDVAPGDGVAGGVGEGGEAHRHAGRLAGDDHLERLELVLCRGERRGRGRGGRRLRGGADLLSRRRDPHLRRGGGPCGEQNDEQGNRAQSASLVGCFPFRRSVCRFGYQPRGLVAYCTIDARPCARSSASHPGRQALARRGALTDVTRGTTLARPGAARPDRRPRGVRIHRWTHVRVTRTGGC